MISSPSLNSPPQSSASQVSPDSQTVVVDKVAPSTTSVGRARALGGETWLVVPVYGVGVSGGCSAPNALALPASANGDRVSMSSGLMP